MRVQTSPARDYGVASGVFIRAGPLPLFELSRGLLAELDPTSGFKAQLGRVFQIQLLSNASFVRIDCCDAKIQLRSDLSCREAMANQIEHFKFAVGKPLDW